MLYRSEAKIHPRRAVIELRSRLSKLFWRWHFHVPPVPSSIEKNVCKSFWKKKISQRVETVTVTILQITALRILWKRNEERNERCRFEKKKINKKYIDVNEKQNHRHCFSVWLKTLCDSLYASIWNTSMIRVSKMILVDLVENCLWNHCYVSFRAFVFGIVLFGLTDFYGIITIYIHVKY